MPRCKKQKGGEMPFGQDTPFTQPATGFVGDDMNGAGFFDDVGDFFSGVGDGIMKGVDFVSNVGQKVLPLAMAVKGMGLHIDHLHKRVAELEKRNGISGGSVQAVQQVGQPKRSIRMRQTANPQAGITDRYDQLSDPHFNADAYNQAVADSFIRENSTRGGKYNVGAGMDGGIYTVASGMPKTSQKRQLRQLLQS